ncbi:MAG: CGNR zinc finger domain-containing protein [Vicinamibacterales bacterium]
MAAVPLPDAALDANRALAFVNTLSARPTAAPSERLVSYEALVDWAREEKLIAPAVSKRLSALARRHPQQAAAALARALELREAVYGVVAALDAKRTPAAAALDTISRDLAWAYSTGRLVLHAEALHWVSGSQDDLNRVLWEVARTVGRLVTSPGLAKVRLCAAGDCGWLFLDDTKNRSRRWCDMKICGNREKLRRFRARQA